MAVASDFFVLSLFFKMLLSRDDMNVTRKGKLNVGWGDTQLLPAGWIFKIGIMNSWRAKVIKKKFREPLAIL